MSNLTEDEIRLLIRVLVEPGAPAVDLLLVHCWRLSDFAVGTPTPISVGMDVTRKIDVAAARNTLGLRRIDYISPWLCRSRHAFLACRIAFLISVDDVSSAAVRPLRSRTVVDAPALRRS